MEENNYIKEAKEELEKISQDGKHSIRQRNVLPNILQQDKIYKI